MGRAVPGARRTLSGGDALAGLVHGPVHDPVHDPVHVRRAQAADAASLASFADRAFRTTYGPAADAAEGGGSRLEDVAAYADAHFTVARIGAGLADPALATFVAESQGALAGYAQLRLPGERPTGAPPGDAPTAAGARPAELARLYVDRAWQGRGVADALLDAVTGAATAAGATGLWLCVYQRNLRAVAFYRRRGFTVGGAATFRMGDEVQDDWVMGRAV